MPPKAARYAVLLRGVNVGGHRRVPMARWKDQLEALGCTDVTTYLQSGNAVVTSSARPDALGRQVAEALARDLDVDTEVLVRDGRELARVVDGNPFPAAVAEPKFLHVAFLASRPDAADVARLDPAMYEPDEFVVADGAVYLWYRNSPARSKLGTEGLRRLKVPATARNWTTVQALAAATAA